jgi:phosphate transport system protein
MYETRHQFHHELDELETRTLGGLDLVVGQLDWALESVRGQDVELAGLVIADDDRIDGRYLEVHQGVLSLLACQAPVAGDLRRIAALLHVIRCIERMGDQCVNIAKLVPLAGEPASEDSVILDAIERMGQLARRDVTTTREAFKSRDLTLARELIGQGARIGRPRDLYPCRAGRREHGDARVGDVHDSRRSGA